MISAETCLKEENRKMSIMIAEAEEVKAVIHLIHFLKIQGLILGIGKVTGNIKSRAKGPLYTITLNLFI